MDYDLIVIGSGPGGYTAAILSVGAGEARAVVRDGQLASETVMTVTLTCDHRIIDGATGAKWLAAFRATLEQPDALLA